jgi:hypothetical protein
MSKEFADELLVTPSVAGPEGVAWEELLAEEGMPAELPYNIASASDPDVPQEPAANDVYSIAAPEGAYASFQEQLHADLEVLSKRQKDAAGAPHDLTGDEPKTFEVISEANELAAGHLQRAVSRRPHIKAPLHSRRPNVSEQDDAQQQKVTNKTSVFEELPVVAVIDPEDDRPYATRLEEAHHQATANWLEDKLRDLKGIEDYGSVRAELDHIIQMTEDLHKSRSRILERPGNANTQDQRQASILVIDIKLAALREYQMALAMRGIAIVYGN